MLDVEDPGYVYALVNPHMPGLLKIGRTSGSAADRAKQLGTTGVPGNFTVAWESQPLARVSLAEREVHSALSRHRLRGGEFFRISLEEARPTLESTESKYLDHVWVAERARAQREKEARLAREALAVAQRRERAAPTLRLFDEWIGRPEVQRARANASQVPDPWLSIGCVGVPLGLLLMVGMFAALGLWAILALFLVGPVLGLIEKGQDDSVWRRRREAWIAVRNVTPDVIWDQLQRSGWNFGEDFRQILEKRASEPHDSLLTSLASDSAPDPFTLVRKGKVGDLRSALEGGVSPALKTGRGFTLLHVAAEGGRHEVCKALLVAGADADAANQFGQTPLHRAALRGASDVADVLLDHGADPGVADLKGKRPFDLADLMGHTDLADRLRRLVSS